MTNKEYFKDKIFEMACNGKAVTVDFNGNLASCNRMACRECRYMGSSDGCAEKFREWCDSEYAEPVVYWERVPVDTPVHVKSREDKVNPRYFAKYENGNIYYFANGKTSFTSSINDMVHAERKDIQLAMKDDIEKYSSNN